MEPVLIYTDTNRINTEKNAFNKFPALFQSIYNAFKAINITVTIEEINNLIAWTVNHNGSPGYVENFAINKLLDAAAPYELNGVALSREKVRDMMVVPNTTAITQALAASYQNFMGNIIGVRTALLSLANDTISKVADADTQITNEFTYYSKTDASAQLATDLLVVCAAMNAFDAAYNDALKQGDPPAMPNALKIYNNQFVIDLTFIRQFEANQVA